MMDEEIIQMLVDLDDKQANYQELHRFYYGKDDEEAKRIHKLIVSLFDKLKDKLRNK